MCLVVDKVGSDFSQKGNGHIGGAKYACEKGTRAYFDRNYSPGKLFPGDTTCKFQGKEIPCMVW